MTDNYLITGYWGEPHVTAENDRGINAAIFGPGRFVLPVGEQFRAEYIGNNTIRIHDGKLMDNGAAGGIPAGEYIDLVISNAAQGKGRNDLIVFQYEQDASTLIESGRFVVVQGTEVSGNNGTDPELRQEDLLSGEATFDQMPLWRVTVYGTTIYDPVKVYSDGKSIPGASIPVVAATSVNGINYTATVPGLNELYPGLEITIIPDRESKASNVGLAVNGFGSLNVRLPHSSSTGLNSMPRLGTHFSANVPVKLMYTFVGSVGTWVVVGRQYTSADDLNGRVSVQHGGWDVNSETTESDKALARENLMQFVYSCGTEDMTAGTTALETGKLYFVYE